MAQTIKGDGSGGICPECNSENTKCREKQYCEACEDLIYEKCHCYDCGLNYEHEYSCMCEEDASICPECGTQMKWVESGGEWGWYCPECGA